MMTQEQAAKYFVVAWVKAWKMRAYLFVLADGGQRIEWENANTAYKWLPKDIGIFARNTTVRRYIADAFPKLNNKMWDAKDNAERLVLVNRIMKCDGGAVKMRDDRASIAMSNTKKIYRDTMMVNRMSINEMRRGNGAAWTICK